AREGTRFRPRRAAMSPMEKVSSRGTGIPARGGRRGRNARPTARCYKTSPLRATISVADVPSSPYPGASFADAPPGDPTMHAQLLPFSIRVCLTLIFMFFPFAAGHSQPPAPKPGDEMIEKSLAQQTDNITQRASAA